MSMIRVSSDLAITSTEELVCAPVPLSARNAYNRLRRRLSMPRLETAKPTITIPLLIRAKPSKIIFRSRDDGTNDIRKYDRANDQLL